jgi:uncharacterized protein (DUF1501 family)
MKRRQFIKLSSTASAIGLMPFQVNASLKLMNSFFNCDVSNRKLVLVELAGGNDGLNTVIPIMWHLMLLGLVGFLGRYQPK